MNILEDIPESPPLGGFPDYLGLILAGVLCLLAVAYLLWKLPRKGSAAGDGGDDSGPPAG